MTEIHVINHSNRDYYSDIINSYYRTRHDIFVGERKWMTLFSPTGLETDQYDNDNSIYLLALDGERVVGGQRLYPTLLPHMISETFPFLVERQLPVGDQILEWTRYFVVRERRRGPTDGMLLAAVQRYCLDEGITELTAVAEMWWLPRWHQYGFTIHPLGLPQMVDGQPTLAVKVEISEESYANVLRAAGLERTALTRWKIDIPAAGRVPHAA